MRVTAVVASLMRNYKSEFRALKHPPTEPIYLAARASSSSAYLKRVLEQAEEAGVDVSSIYLETWSALKTARSTECDRTVLLSAARGTEAEVYPTLESVFYNN